MDLDENLLGDIISVVVVNYHFPCEPIDPLLVGSYQHIEPVASRFGVSDFGQQFVVLQGVGSCYLLDNNKEE